MAVIITETDNFGSKVDFTNVEAFAQFNPALGTLTSIDLSVTTTLAVDETLRNLGTSTESFSFLLSESLNFADSTGSFSGVVNSTTGAIPESLASGGSTVVSTNVGGTNTNYTGITTPSVLAAYTGTGTVNVTLTTSTSVTVSGGGGVIIATNDPVLSGEVVVVYHYTQPSLTPPAVGIGVYSNNPVVFYPTAGNGAFSVQMTTNLSTSNWVNVSNAVPMTAIMVTNAGSNAYFRLH